MKKERKRMLARAVGFAMTAVMFVSSNGMVLAAETAGPNGANEIIDSGGMTNQTMEEHSAVEISSADDWGRIFEYLSGNYVLTGDINLKNIGGGVQIQEVTKHLLRVLSTEMDILFPM